MPKQRSGSRRRPEGWPAIAPRLAEIDREMRDAAAPHAESAGAESAGGDGGGVRRPAERMWAVFRALHRRSRYVWDEYRGRRISRELYDYCVKRRIVDAALVAKWKKPGFGRLCCVQCVAADSQAGTKCICRVPEERRPAESRAIECRSCGCRGCSS